MKHEIHAEFGRTAKDRNAVRAQTVRDTPRAKQVREKAFEALEVYKSQRSKRVPA